MPNKEEADMAVSGLNGKDLKGRNLTIKEARRDFVSIPWGIPDHLRLSSSFGRF